MINHEKIQRIRENIWDFEYTSKKPFPHPKSRLPEAQIVRLKTAHEADQQPLTEQFMRDLLDAAGLTEHPKAALIVASLETPNEMRAQLIAIAAVSLAAIVLDVE